MTRVKFCGITNLEDAELCAEHGAWALGMIFVSSSPRRCRQTEAARIAGALRRRVELAGVFRNATLEHVARTTDALELAGVFRNATLEHVARTTDALGLSLVQLHGDEGPAFCAEIARRTGAKIMKASRVRSRADIVALEPFRTDFHLLDGGGGEPFDWGLVSQRRSAVPLLVAGGLTAENVEDAIAVTEPWGVDVASGVERDGQPGVKDPERVAAFAAAVHGARVA